MVAVLIFSLISLGYISSEKTDDYKYWKEKSLETEVRFLKFELDQVEDTVERIKDHQ